MYYFALIGVKILQVLPLRFLYLLSDIFYPLLYYVIRYRRRVVQTNIANSFPEKSSKDRKEIERRFYRHFCDLALEGLKLGGMSVKQISSRMRFEGYEQILEHYDEGRSVMVLTSHYGNWEWNSAFALLLPQDRPVYLVYRKQKDDISDRIIGSIRRKFGGKTIEKKNLYRTLVKMRQTGQIATFGMISDQSPARHSIHYWTRFLNQPTAMIDGTEQIARKFNYPVYYCVVNKEKRGYYTGVFVPISTEPSQTKEFEITEQYARLLERDIQKKPEYWLWSHKRWKHKPPEKEGLPRSEN